MELTRVLLVVALCMISPFPLRAFDIPIQGTTYPTSESEGFVNLWVGLGGLHNLAWEKGSPYEFSNSLAWGFGLGFGNRWGPFWWKLSGGVFGNLGSDPHIDTINGQSGEFQRSVGLIHAGVDVCYFISAAEGRFKIGPSVGGRFIYEEALIHPSHGRIVWEISELYLGPAFGIQTKYDNNENWTIVGSVMRYMRYNTSPRFDRATAMILFRKLFRISGLIGTGYGIDLWFKDGRYKSINFFFIVAGL